LARRKDGTPFVWMGAGNSVANGSHIRLFSKTEKYYKCIYWKYALFCM